MKARKDKPKKGERLVKSSNLFPVVGIGASAGGLDAFKKLLKGIPQNSGMAYVLIQHLDPTHESLLPELLQKVTIVPVLEASNDISVEPDHIYIIPSNKMLTANDGVLHLQPRPAPGKNVRNFPIDLFFISLAEVHQSHSIGVVLSGTGSDGTLGLKAIRDNGGLTFAQDEQSAGFREMPRNAVDANVVDFILPPEKITEKLLEVTALIKNGGEVQNTSQDSVDEVKQILSLLRVRKGTDFTYYRQTTISRRIHRRMALTKSKELSDYLNLLRENKAELDLLHQDLLIPVTTFFRDNKIYDTLIATVFPLIAKNKLHPEPLRIWVAGCSTGEEAYSIAICFKEFFGDKPEKAQIFATDISEPAIAKARSGVYSKSELGELSPQRLQDFFTNANGSYHINKDVRDMCVFAVHNFLKDPPFGKMDLISCRNVLIYMEPYLQKKALSTFHYALNPKGFLLLGKSETTNSVPDLFTVATRLDKIFSKKAIPRKFTSARSEVVSDVLPEKIHNKNENVRTDFQKAAYDIILNQHSPSGVIVNEAMEIVHFHGNNGEWLQLATGKPSHDILKLAKSGLAFELRNILHKAKKENKPVIRENIPLKVNANQCLVSFEAIPLPNVVDRDYLVLFHNTTTITKGDKKTSTSKLKIEKDGRIQQLEQEIAQLREDMRSITEDQEATNEELQSANEELQSGSEELQSLNEEIETSKEELQSTNEELTVVNHELIALNEQVTEERNYANGIISTVRGPLVVLDKQLKVKSANNSFYKTFLVNENETEGKLFYDLGNKQWDIPELRSMLEAVLPKQETIHDFEITSHFPAIGERTMLLNAKEIVKDGGAEKLVLVSIEDITERTKSAAEGSMLSAIVTHQPMQLSVKPWMV
jgi:two-component system, chemotaxis family, CheB/CheR fusion protein